MNHLSKTTALASLGLLLCAMPAYANDIEPGDLLNLSLEQLSNIEVTSVSKKSEKASEAAAAIYVLTQDDIHRSGMTNIPELLRQVPGLDVAQSGSHQWAVSSRGSNDQFANKMLVLIDGRSVYTPLYSGVYWDVQDTPLEDIERIEVIRGPGATVWGANAVNGVINIITKSAKDTQGAFVSQSVGNQLNSMTTARYGTKLGDNGFVRAYAKYDNNDEFKNMAGSGANDAWDKKQGGFRADWKAKESEKFTLQGDIYESGNDNTFNLLQANATTLATDAPEKAKGGNVLGRWEHNIAKDSDMTLQLYFDEAKRSNVVYESDVKTFDVDVQHVWTPIEGNEVVWGAGYRLVKSEFEGNANTVLGIPYITFTPDSRSDNLFSAFIQDKITLLPNSLFLTLGSKFEKNDFTGFEYQPSGRLTWLVDDKQTVWSSVSRAVRTPNFANTNAQVLTGVVSAGPSVFLARNSSNTLNSEELVAYEAGYRIEPSKKTSIDIATYYNDYSRLMSGALGPATGPFFAPGPVPYFLQTVVPTSVGTGHSWGLETSFKWTPTSYADLAFGYSLEQLKFDQAEPVYGFPFDGRSPQQQFNIRSTIKLPYNVEWSSALYYVDALKFVDVNTGNEIDGYYRLDTRLAWQAMDNLELSLVGQNLLDNQHQEFSGFLYQNSSQVPRAFYGNVSVKF